jgi:DNA-binding response OmpR family regulator
MHRRIGLDDMEPATSTIDVDLTGTRVLVVEDDYFIAAEICGALRRRGATIIGPASDIAHGTALARAQSIEIAILDINLHGELAFDLARELRARGTAAIFATGYDPGVLPQDLAEVTYLEKPVNLNELIHAVQTWSQSRLPAVPALLHSPTRLP